MSRLTDYELEELLQDAGDVDRKQWFPRPFASRISRLLEEQRELRDQDAERQFMSELEGSS